MLDRKTKTKATVTFFFLIPSNVKSQEDGYLWGREVDSVGEGHEGASGLLSCSISSAGYSACSPGGHSLNHILAIVHFLKVLHSNKKVEVYHNSLTKKKEITSAQRSPL